VTYAKGQFKKNIPTAVDTGGGGGGGGGGGAANYRIYIAITYVQILVENWPEPEIAWPPEFYIKPGIVRIVPVQAGADIKKGTCVH